jgi:hypothetical protein
MPDSNTHQKPCPTTNPRTDLDHSTVAIAAHQQHRNVDSSVRSASASSPAACVIDIDDDIVSAATASS